MSSLDADIKEHLEHWLQEYARKSDGMAREDMASSDTESVAVRLERAERCFRLMAMAWSTDPTNGPGTLSRSMPSSEMQEPRCGDRMPIQPSGRSMTSTSASAGTTVSRGMNELHFGRLKILNQRGCGGQGMVYHAYDPVLERDVALKIPHPQWLTTRDRRQRFVQECQILAQLSHPHLTTVFEAATDGVVSWMICEYCHGPSLATWLSKHRVAQFRDAVKLIRQLADTVDYIHSRGVLHRDIKPGNILLEPKGRRAADSCHLDLNGFSPKLTDFGLARLSSVADTHTKTGAILGTPPYMSPEQVEGRREDVGMATDVYALGAVLYELLTGRPPTRGRTELEVLRQVVEGSIVPLRQVEPGVPVDLESICLKCLEHRTERRYESAAELGRDLDRFLAHEPVRARPPSQVARVTKWSRRNPLVAGLCVIIFVGLFTGLTVAAWQWHQMRSQYFRAERNFGEALKAVTNFHETLYEGSHADAPQFRQLRKSMTEMALRHYEALLAERPNDRMILRAMADGYQQIAFVHYEAGGHDAAVELYEKAISIWQRLSDEGFEDNEMRYFVAQTHCRLGHLRHRQGRLEEALQHLDISHQIGHELVRADPTAVEAANVMAECLSTMAGLHRQLEQLDDAISAAREAIELRKGILARQPEHFHHHRLLAKAYLSAADAFVARKEYARAKESCLLARQIQEELVQRNEAAPWSRADLAQSLRLLGYLSSRESDQVASLNFYAAACRQLERLCEEPSALASFGNQLADSLTELALQQRVCGKLDAAIEHHRRARDVYSAITDHDRRELNVMKSNFYLGQLYLQKQLLADAVEHFRLAILSQPDASACPQVSEEAQYFLSATRQNLRLANCQINGPQ